MIQLHSTYQPNHYYCPIFSLPKELIQLIKDTPGEVDCSSYTCGLYTGFIRGELTLDGVEYSFEVCVGDCDVSNAGYEYSDDADGYIDDSGRLVDPEEHAESMLGELIEYACDIENLSVYLTEV